MDSEPRNNIEAGTVQREGDCINYSCRFPPGVRFNPEDDELIVHYLNRKIKDQPLPYNVFFDVKLYDYNPDELADTYKIPGQERLYFFTPRSRKYPNGNRPARAAGNGYWKATGSEKKIYNKDELVGVKRTLVYYKGKAKKADGTKTNWTMHEYISKLTTESVCKSDDSMKLDDRVLCCIQKKRRAIDKADSQSKVSQAQSSDEGCMPIKQVANSEGSYHTNIDSNGDHINANIAQTFSVASSKLITSFNGMEQSFATESSHESETYHDTMLQTPVVVPNEPMVNFDATGQPSNSAPIIELNEMMSNYNNYSIGQDFQQNTGSFMLRIEDFVYQFQMGYGERDHEFFASGSGAYPSMELPSPMHDYQPEMGIDDILNDDFKPKELDTDEDNRKDDDDDDDADSKHARDFTKPAP